MTTPLPATMTVGDRHIGNVAPISPFDARKPLPLVHMPVLNVPVPVVLVPAQEFPLAERSDHLLLRGTRSTRAPGKGGICGRPWSGHHDRSNQCCYGCDKCTNLQLDSPHRASNAPCSENTPRLSTEHDRRIVQVQSRIRPDGLRPMGRCSAPQSAGAPERARQSIFPDYRLAPPRPQPALSRSGPVRGRVTGPTRARYPRPGTTSCQRGLAPAG